MRKFFLLLCLSIFLLYLNLTPFVRFEREKFFILIAPPFAIITSVYKTSIEILQVYTKINYYKNENALLKEKVADKDKRIIELSEQLKDGKFINEQQLYTKGLKIIQTKLIGIKQIDGNTLFVIDKGIIDGVEEKNTVVYKGYLIGNVYKAENKTSFVKTIQSANIEVPAESLKNSSSGIYTCVESICTFEKILTSSTLDINEPVISSGVSDDYKRGFIIGSIAKVESSPEEPFKTAQLSFDFNLEAISQMGVILNEK